MGLKSKNLLGLKDLTADEIEYILNTAKTMKLILNSKNKKLRICKVNIVTLFYEKQYKDKVVL